MKSSYLKYILCFIACWSNWAISWTQEPAMWHLANKDGLVSMTIYSILQDQKAFLWFGTENGLCRYAGRRYDGYSFKNYSHSKAKGNEIISVKSMRGKQIFFRNLEGQLFFIKNDSTFLFQDEAPLKGYKVHSHYIEANRLWLIASIGSNKRELIRYSFNEYLEIKDKKIYKNISPFAFSEDHNALILFTKSPQDHLHIHQYDIQEDRFKIPFPNSNSYFLKPSKLSPEVAIFKNNQKFINNASTVFKINAQNEVIDSLTISSGNSIHRLYSFENELWMVTHNGVIRLDPNDLKKNLGPPLLSNYTVNFLYKDSEKNLWVGTNAQGICVIPSIDIVHFNIQNSKLPDNRIFVIKAGEKTDELILGHGRGQISFLKDRKIIHSLNLNSSEQVRVIHKITAQGDWSDVKFLKHKEIIQNPFTNKKDLLCSTSAKSITQDQEGNYWFGTYQYTYQIDKGLKTRRSLLSKRTYALHHDYEKNLWIGTTQGIHKSTKDSIALFEELNRPNLYSVNAILQSKDSTIWVATQADGLLAIRQDSIFRRFTIKNGLQTNTCKNLFLDEDNHLWVGTNKGIYAIQLDNFKIFHLDENDGLASNEINALYASKKSIWVGSPEGLTILPRKKLQKINRLHPKIHISKFKVWEKDMPLQKTYQLNHKQNNLNIEFIGVAHRNRDNIQYKYRLLGLDTNWVKTTSPFARFPYLDSGDYTFEVVALNADQVQSAESATLKIKIRQAWWKTFPFLLSIFLLATFTVVGIIYRRQQYLLAKQKEQLDFQEKLNSLKNQALQSQMNPHFVFNALSAIQKYLTTNEQEEAMLYLSKFARLIRLIFEYSKIQLISLAEEINFLKLYLELEKLRFGKKVTINFEIAPTLQQNQELIKIPPLLIQPIIENAFKHGLLHKSQEGKLSVKFEASNNNYIRCIIEDNGVGREKAQTLSNWKPKEYQSSGLSTTVQRLNIINQLSTTNNKVNHIEIIDLKNNIGKATGTKVIIHIISTSSLN